MEKGKLVLEDRLYTKTHEWVKKVGENKYQIGITDYAQYELKDISAVELLKIGKEVKQFQEWGIITSNKGAIELCSPISGKVIATNQDNFGELSDERDEPSPTTIGYWGEFFNINKKPYETWLMEVETDDESQLGNLLNHEGYKKVVEKERKKNTL